MTAHTEVYSLQAARTKRGMFLNGENVFFRVSILLNDDERARPWRWDLSFGTMTKVCLQCQQDDQEVNGDLSGEIITMKFPGEAPPDEAAGTLDMILGRNSSAEPAASEPVCH